MFPIVISSFSLPWSLRPRHRAAVVTCGYGGSLSFIHLRCWEVLPSCRFQRQRCIKILCPKDPDFYTVLALKTAKGQHFPALEVYKNQPRIWSLQASCDFEPPKSLTIVMFSGRQSETPCDFCSGTPGQWLLRGSFSCDLCWYMLCMVSAFYVEPCFRVCRSCLCRS